MIKGEEYVIVVVGIPAAILISPIWALGYVLESYFTVKYVFERKIDNYKRSYEFYFNNSQKADNIFDSEKYSANAEYSNSIREAYVSLMNRKTSVELESRYRHKSTMKDDIYRTEKKSAQDKLINSLLTADKKILLSSVINENEVTIIFN